MSTTSTDLWSRPFDELEVGATFTTPSREVTEHDVHAFAALTGDHHPQHVDPAWASESAFGEPIAHGLLVLSCAAGLVPFDPERVVALRKVTDVVFKRPVRPGDAIHVEGSIDALAPPGLVTSRWLVVTGGQTVVRAKVTVVWR